MFLAIKHKHTHSWWEDWGEAGRGRGCSSLFNALPFFLNSSVCWQQMRCSSPHILLERSVSPSSTMNCNLLWTDSACVFLLACSLCGCTVCVWYSVRTFSLITRSKAGGFFYVEAVLVTWGYLSFCTNVKMMLFSFLYLEVYINVILQKNGNWLFVLKYLGKMPKESLFPIWFYRW